MEGIIGLHLSEMVQKLSDFVERERERKGEKKGGRKEGRMEMEGRKRERKKSDHGTPLLETVLGSHGLDLDQILPHCLGGPEESGSCLPLSVIWPPCHVCCTPATLVFSGP